MKRAAWMLVCSTVFATGAPAQDSDSQVSERWGFRIARPGPEWSFVPPGETAGAESFRLDLSRRSERGVVGLRITVASETSGGAEAVQREAEAQVGSSDQYSGLRRVRTRIGGRDAPGIDVAYRDLKLGEYRIRQHYLVRDGLRYTLQCHAPKSQFAAHEREFARFLASFELLPLPAEVVAEARLRGLVGRCGSEIDWASSWDEASARADQGRRPVLVHVRRYPGFNIPNEMRIGPFMDRDIVELVRTRFVALELKDGMPAPFRSQASYGMSGSTFGNALLVVSPDGEVLRETHSPNGSACYDFLVESLANVPELPGDAEPEGLDGVERAERCLQRGELGRTAELCAEPATAREFLVLAGLHRRLRDGPAALAALERAHAVGGADLDTGRIGLDEVMLHLRSGDPVGARKALDALLGGELDASDVPEARFLEGVCALASGEWEAGLEVFQTLVAERPDSRWSWQAAAVLSSPVVDRSTPLRTRWPDASLLAELRTPAAAPSDTPLPEVAQDALRFLIEAQRPDGSWISPSEIGGLRAATNPFVVAITSLAGRCLLQRRASDGAVPAAERALGFVLAAHVFAKQSPPRVTFMDYSVWSESLMLWFLADCIDAGVGDGARLRGLMEELVASLAIKRRPSGGFSYYVTADLAMAAAVPEQAMSFTTAAVVIGLCRARDVGVRVDAGVLEAALDCLERGRNDNGAFDYMVGSAAGAGKTARPGAAGRGPLCELALLRGGRGDLDRLRGALEIFKEHRAGLHKELGKVLMHAGPDGQGCHYLFFDYATAATSVAELPEPERARHREWLLELVLPARSVEGGFRDSPINGWAFGTAMALTALWELGAG